MISRISTHCTVDCLSLVDDVCVLDPAAVYCEAVHLVLDVYAFVHARVLR